MKRFIATLFLAAVFFACNEPLENGANSQPGPIASILAAKVDTTNFTEIHWLDSTVNFGTVNMGEQVKVSFKFRNTGKKPLYLTNVKAGCGCTVPDYTKGAIAPGAEGEVTGAFDTNKAHAGQVSKNIFVTTNTKDGVNHTLTFTGDIKEVK